VGVPFIHKGCPVQFVTLISFVLLTLPIPIPAPFEYLAPYFAQVPALCGNLENPHGRKSTILIPSVSTRDAKNADASGYRSDLVSDLAADLYDCSIFVARQYTFIESSPQEAK
jgi:hypothetical protein